MNTSGQSGASAPAGAPPPRGGSAERGDITDALEHRVRLRPLSIVVEDQDVIVGDPASGTFVEIPAVGGVVIAALQTGASLKEAQYEAERFAGAPVNVSDFVTVLDALGFVDHFGHSDRTTIAPHPARTAPIQGRRWLRGVSPRMARPFFGPMAWTAYTACAVAIAAICAFFPSLFPAPEDAFLIDDIGLSAIILVVLGTLFSAVHEAGHYIAARAVGIEARFGVDHRMGLLVYETDLSQLWRVPRRQRYSPLLGGIATDVVLLAAFLILRALSEAGYWSPPPLAAALLATMVFVKMSTLLWQCLVFLRTDLYAVLVNLLKCRNLWRVKSLLLRQTWGRLTAAEADELANASPHDLRAGKWFRWVWLSGLTVVLIWYGYFRLPVIVEVLHWTAAALAAGPRAGAFWYAPLCALIALGPQGLALALATRDFIQARCTLPEPKGV